MHSDSMYCTKYQIQYVANSIKRQYQQHKQHNQQHSSINRELYVATATQYRHSLAGLRQPTTMEANKGVLWNQKYLRTLGLGVGS
mgnify:FL=1